MILSTDINGQRILKYDLMRDTTRHTQPKEVVSHVTFLDNYLHAINLKDRSIPSRDTDDQKILQSDWVRGTTGHTQPKEVVSDAIFTCT